MSITDDVKLFLPKYVQPIAICWHYLLYNKQRHQFKLYNLSEIDTHIRICRGEYGLRSITPWFIEYL